MLHAPQHPQDPRVRRERLIPFPPYKRPLQLEVLDPDLFLVNPLQFALELVGSGLGVLEVESEDRVQRGLGSCGPGGVDEREALAQLAAGGGVARHEGRQREFEDGELELDG